MESAVERKSETLNLRVAPELKELVRLAAAREHRSISNLVEVLVREYCREQGITVTPVAAQASKADLSGR